MSAAKKTSHLGWQIAAAILSGLLLCTPFLDPHYFVLTWFAFVPILLSIEHTSVWRSYWLGLLMGCIGYANGMYWIVDFIVVSKGYSINQSILIACVYWLYCGHLIALLMLAYRWISTHSRTSSLIIFPVLLASFAAWYPMLFAMRLGDSQVYFLEALQAIEFTGVHGLDVIIGIVNILIFKLLKNLKLGVTTKPESRSMIVGSVVVVLMWFAIGNYLNQSWTAVSDEAQNYRIGIVQSNETPSIGINPSYPGFGLAYPPEMQMTEELAANGAELVIWPEGQSKHYLNQYRVKSAYQQQVLSLGIDLLFQDMQHHIETSSGKLTGQTSKAILIGNDGKEKNAYTKIKRIPFGEYVPLSGGNTLINRAVKAVFGDFLIETTKGAEHKVFELKELNLIPLICYETTEPSFVGAAVNHAKAMLEKSNNTKPNILVAMTNDGWFGSSHQPFQHILPSALRAIENRTPLLHVANNGPSIVVLPNGKIHFIADFQRAGGYIVDLPISPSKTGTVYSNFPHLFENLLLILSLLLLGLTVYYRIKSKAS